MADEKAQQNPGIKTATPATPDAPAKRSLGNIQAVKTGQEAPPAPPRKAAASPAKETASAPVAKTPERAAEKKVEAEVEDEFKARLKAFHAHLSDEAIEALRKQFG